MDTCPMLFLPSNFIYLLYSFIFMPNTGAQSAFLTLLHYFRSSNERVSQSDKQEDRDDADNPEELKKQRAMDDWKDGTISFSSLCLIQL